MENSILLIEPLHDVFCQERVVSFVEQVSRVRHEIRKLQEPVLFGRSKIEGVA